MRLSSHTYKMHPHMIFFSIHPICPAHLIFVFLFISLIVRTWQITSNTKFLIMLIFPFLFPCSCPALKYAPRQPVPQYSCFILFSCDEISCFKSIKTWNNKLLYNWILNLSSPSYNAEGKNEWGHTSIPLHVFKSWPEQNFPFYLSFVLS